MTRPTLSHQLLITATLSGVDIDARQVSGMVVPFGKEGTPGGAAGRKLRFARGSIQLPAEARRVKLLRDHDPRDPVGFGASFTEDDQGLHAVFSVPEGDNGDTALLEADNGLRDGFSVGVELDDPSWEAIAAADFGGVVDASGLLREVSLLTIPAYVDAAVAAAGHAPLVVASWATPETPSGAAAGSTITEEGTNTMTDDNGATEATTATAAAPTPEAQPAPTVVTAAAGAAAQVTSEPSTYTFAGGSEHSLITDLMRAGLRNDTEAAERVARFNRQLATANPATQRVMITAVATRDDVDGAGTDLPSYFQPNPNRPELMRQLVDVKRPFVSRLDKITITNAQPFAIPVVGEFSGVGTHTEGTPHRPAGTLTLGGDTVQPTAVSGAWEVSRELLDAANPALDSIAVRAMIRDYQRQSEGRIITLIDTLAATAAEWVYGVDTAMDMRNALIDFVNDDDEPADLAVVSKAMLQTLGSDIDGQDRAQLPYVGHANALGSMQAGYTGLTIDGHEIVRSARLDSGVADANRPAAGGIGVLARSQGILWAESAVQQFRFDEVLGPGVVKLALWAYAGAAILDTADVQLIATGADPTP
jgi:HK97 family phage prohead protease